MMKKAALCLLVLFLASCTRNDGEAGSESYRVLQTVAVGAQSVQIYVARHNDLAVLGLGTKNREGRQDYCPLFVSLDGSIPAVTLTASVADSKQTMWVESSWPDAAVLGVYRAGDDHCLTVYGAKPLIEHSIPQDFGGSVAPIPAPDRTRITATMTVKYTERPE